MLTTTDLTVSRDRDGDLLVTGLPDGFNVTHIYGGTEAPAGVWISGDATADNVEQTAYALLAIRDFLRSEAASPARQIADAIRAAGVDMGDTLDRSMAALLEAGFTITPPSTES